METIQRSVSRAIESMAYENVIWDSPSSYEFESNRSNQDDIIDNALYGTKQSSYLDYVAKVLGCRDGYRQAVKFPSITAGSHAANRVRRTTTRRGSRPAVRQTFAARSAAKSGDDGGGDSDPAPRHRHSTTQHHHLNNAVSTFQGGAK